MLQINNYNIEIIPSIIFLGELLDENLSWKGHIRYTENKIFKNIGILYQTRDCLIKENFLVIIPCPYSHKRKLCQFSMGKYDKNKLKENQQSVKACHSHYLS